MQEGAGDSDHALSSSSSDVKADKKICDPSRCESPEVEHITITKGIHDDQSQGPPDLQPLSPYFPPVATPPAESLPIRPFPLLEFLESHELTVLLASLEASDEGTFPICHVILH